MKRFTEIINRYVFELWVGILVFGVICEFGVFFISDVKAYSICLLSGIITAIISAYHMWWSLDRALEMGEAQAAKKMATQYVIRYVFYVIVLGITGVLFSDYVLATFLGIMSIKVASYLQPLSKKLSVVIYGEEILPPVIENLYEDQEKPVKSQE